MLRANRSKTRVRGQGLAEFAIVLPVLMLILGGIIQFGVIFWGQNTLNQVVRDTGRYAASVLVDPTTCDTTANRNDVIARANAIAGSSSFVGSVTGVTVTWSGSPCPPTKNTEVAWVQIQMTAQVPVFFVWVPGNGSIGSSTEFRMEPRNP